MMRASVFVLAWALAALAVAGPRNPLDALRLQDLNETRARPLFAPTRRPPPPIVRAAPPPPPIVEAKPAPPAAPPFELLGAVVGERDSFVLLRRQGGAKALRLRAGDEAEGWRVGQIGLRSVTLERNGSERTLALQVAHSRAAAPEARTTETPAPAPPSSPLAENLARNLRRERK
jgi:general secretion pathway protein N